MAAERIIGVDFGTSTSVIRVKQYEDGKPIGKILETKEVIFGGSGATVPTLVMKKNKDESVTYYGYEAQERRKGFTNFHSFKVDLESSDPEKRAQARRLTEEFFRFMAKQYADQSKGRHLGNPDDKERTIISYPVKWSDETKRFMIETAKKAHFPNVSGMDEAQAAIKAVTVMNADYLRNHGLLKNGVAANILLLDMGADTTDLVLCRYTHGSVEPAKILNTWPKSGELRFGGKEIDSLLQNFFRDKMDEEAAQMVFNRVGTDKFKSWKEETVSPALRENDSVSDFEVLDSYVEMMDIDMEEYCLDRAGFENCLKDYLKQLPILINDCIEHSDVRGENVDLVIAIGGHSQWYFVKEMLAGKMPQFGQVDLAKIKEEPARIIPVARPQETVALGLAYHDITVEGNKAMVAERIIGVDFGTSTSVIRVKRYENGEPIGEKLETKEVIFNNSAMVPTLVMKKDEDESVTYYGHEAQKRKTGFTNFHSFKVDLESADPEKCARARKLTEEFFRFMAKQYAAQSEGGHLGNSDDKERTIISYPVKWSDETKQFMIETAKKAGFPNVSGMDEAQAAIHAVMVQSVDYLKNHDLLINGVPANVLLIDMGAGTTDLALCRLTPGDKPSIEVLDTWPKGGDILFGGREIDSLLQNFFRNKMNAQAAQMVFSRVGTDKFKSWKEVVVSPNLRKNDSVSYFEVLDSYVQDMGINMGHIVWTGRPLRTA